MTARPFCLLGCAALALLLGACETTTNKPIQFSASPPPVEAAPTTGPAIAAETYQGTVAVIGTNSRNFPRSLTLNTANGPVAINVPDILSDALALTTKSGDAITAVVGTTTTDEGQPAYILLSFTSPGGMSFSVPSADARTYAHVGGTIKAVAKDKHGVPISILLSTGDIVRFDARTSKAPEIEVGETFTGEGNALPLSKSRVIVQAVAVNGLTLRVNLPPGGWGRRVDEGDAGDTGGEAMDAGGDTGGGGE